MFDDARSEHRALIMEQQIEDTATTREIFQMQQGSDDPYREEGWTESPHLGNQHQHRILIGFLLTLALFGIAFDYFTNRQIEHACLVFINWVEANPFGWIVSVICVYALATILFVPGAILTMGCGFAFRSTFDSTANGVAFAAVAVFIGAFIGSLHSFLLGRYLFRDCVLWLARSYPILRAVDRGTHIILWVGYFIFHGCHLPPLFWHAPFSKKKQHESLRFLNF